jgi:hypothetical protein
MFFIGMMNTSSKMNHSVHALERVLPVSFWTDRPDQHIVAPSFSRPYRAADNPSEFPPDSDGSAGFGELR